MFSSSLRVTAGLRAILCKCLQSHAEDRYPSAATLLEDLERETAHLPLVHAPEPILSGRLFKLVRRYPRFFAVSTVLTACSLIVGILISSLRESNERNLRLEAAESFAEFRTASDQVFLSFLDSTSTAPEERTAKRSDLLASAFRTAGLVPDPRSQELRWNRIAPVLSDTEQHQLEQRLLAVSFFALQHILQSQAALRSDPASMELRVRSWLRSRSS